MKDAPPLVSIVMRSYNDADLIRDTIDIVRRQKFRDFELWNFDSSSNDGTLEIIREHNDAAHIRLNNPAIYNPGRILNEAAACCRGRIIVFINSDATPQHEQWLEHLVAPLLGGSADVTFGRQSPRADCRSLFIKDTERAFGDGRQSANWVHFFSMANSAVRRDLVEAFPFATKIQYSEDIEWSYRLRLAGYRIAYQPGAAATHSHNYSIAESYKRHYGEGKAEAWIFRHGEINFSLLRYCIYPFCMELLRDLAWSYRHASWDALSHTLLLRLAQKWGRWRGMCDGRRMYENNG
jgi:rhamnosyltransferase